MVSNRNPTVGELCRAAEISDAENNAAVDACTAASKAKPFPFGSDHEVDVAAAGADRDRTSKVWRTMGRTAGWGSPQAG